MKLVWLHKMFPEHTKGLFVHLMPWSLLQDRPMHQCVPPMLSFKMAEWRDVLVALGHTLSPPPSLSVDLFLLLPLTSSFLAQTMFSVRTWAVQQSALRYCASLEYLHTTLSFQSTETQYVHLVMLFLCILEYIYTRIKVKHFVCLSDVFLIILFFSSSIWKDILI